jgi:hypothetical protein
MLAPLLQDPITAFFPRIRSNISNRQASSGQLISKQVFMKALDAFNAGLEVRDEYMTLLCVGGGAMMLAYSARQSTEDLDVILRPGDPKVFDQIVKEVSAEFTRTGVFDLPRDWMNRDVEPIMRSQGFKLSNFEEHPAYHWSHLTLMFGKPGYILSMKCMAMRTGKRDFRDIESLVRKLNIRSIGELQSAVEPYMNWAYIGNDELNQLKIAIASAFPGETEHESHLQDALARYRKIKSEQQARNPPGN